MANNDIAIEGYEPVIPNAVWRQRGRKVMCCSKHGDIDASSFLRFDVYTAPTDEEVLRAIHGYAMDFRDSGLKIKNKPILSFMSTLNPSDLDLILQGDEGVMKTLKENIPRGSYEAGRTYLDVAGGTVADRDIDNLKMVSNKPGRPKSFVYGVAITLKAQDNWNVRLMLDDPKRLPPAELIEALKSAGVTESRVLSVRGNRDSYADVYGRLSMIYNALDSPKKVGRVRDNSAYFSEAIEMLTLKGSCRSVMAHEDIVVMGPGGLEGLGGFEGLEGLEGLEALKGLEELLKIKSFEELFEKITEAKKGKK